MMGRLPERDTRVGATDSRFKWRPSNATIAVIFILVFTVGPYLAFTKHVPFTSYGYELNATFSNGVNISTNSPVRIAGVDVGRVIAVERDGDNTKVTFTVEGKGRPIHDDAFAAIRPRIFLEGNFFIDLDPGSPSAPELDSGDDDPGQPHLDRGPARRDPHRAAVAGARRPQPPAGELRHGADPQADRGRRRHPAARGARARPAAKALNGAFHYGGDAGRYSAQVTNALLGTQPRRPLPPRRRRRPRLRRPRPPRGGPQGPDRQLRHLHRRPRRPVGQPLDHGPAPGADAADRPQLAGQPQPDAAAAARLGDRDEARPSPSCPAWIAAGKPWIAQARPLLSGKEAGGTAKLLREATPGLAGAAQAGKAIALPQLNRISLCTSKVLVPTGNQVIERPVLAPASPTTASSSTRWPTSPAGARTSTATAPSCGCSPAAATSWSNRTNPNGQPHHRQAGLRPHDRRRRSAPSRSSAAGRRRSRKCAATATRSPTSTPASARSAPPARRW